jgi:hypothetical protein
MSEVEGHVVLYEGEEVSTEVVLPTGEIVDLADPASCAVALSRVNELLSFLQEVKGSITESFVEQTRMLGKNDIPLGDGTCVKVTHNYDLAWDHHALEDALRAAGMPEERIAEIVVEEVSYKVKALEANKAAKTNPEYAAAIEASRTKVERRPTISLPRG